jgi:hypothetical protein
LGAKVTPHERLINYLRDVEFTPFEWGVHDCFTFTNGAFRAMYGEGWADDWLGRYMKDGQPMRAQELRRTFGFSTIEGAIDKKLQRVSGFAPRGALVSTDKVRRWVTGVALGVGVGGRAAFLDKSGVVYLPINNIRDIWVPR